MVLCRCLGLFGTALDLFDQIVVEEGGLTQEKSDFDKEFMQHLLKKIDWPALVSTASDVRPNQQQCFPRVRWRWRRHSVRRHSVCSCRQSLGRPLSFSVFVVVVAAAATTAAAGVHDCQLGLVKLPAEIPAGAEEDEGFLRSVHNLVLDVRHENSKHNPST